MYIVCVCVCVLMCGKESQKERGKRDRIVQWGLSDLLMGNEEKDNPKTPLW